eukprot:scaffold307353_cov18-Prasinocladus_malaysianus.AAC.1
MQLRPYRMLPTPHNPVDLTACMIYVMYIRKLPENFTMSHTHSRPDILALQYKLCWCSELRARLSSKAPRTYRFCMSTGLSGYLGALE